MDFKKPERPSEDLDRRFDGTDGVIPAPHPQATPVKRGSSVGHKIMTAFLLILLVAATGYAVYAYMNEQQLRNDLTKTQAELSSLKDGKDSVVAKAEAADDAEKMRNDMSDEAQKRRVDLSAGMYWCLIKDFGCEKVASSVTKFQAYKITTDPAAIQDGYAIVTATPATNGQAIKIYLKSRDGLEWVVIYDGQNTPSKEIADRFEIPASFR